MISKWKQNFFYCWIGGESIGIWK